MARGKDEMGSRTETSSMSAMQQLSSVASSAYRNPGVVRVPRRRCAADYAREKWVREHPEEASE
jgi:hypothetical protein